MCWRNTRSGSRRWSERHRIRSHCRDRLSGLLINGALGSLRVSPSGRSFRWRSGFLGAAAIDRGSRRCLRSGALASFVRWCGENSLPIYLAFFLPMAAARVLINKSGLIADAGTEAAIVTAVAIAGALVIHRLAMPTRLRFLFERPDAFRLKPPLHLAAAALREPAARAINAAVTLVANLREISWLIGA